MLTQSKNILREILNVLLVYALWKTEVYAAEPTVSILNLVSR
jgi:replication initiation and membrane attachment protein DnaB